MEFGVTLKSRLDHDRNQQRSIANVQNDGQL